MVMEHDGATNSKLGSLFMDIRFKSVRLHDDGSSEHTLGYKNTVAK